MKWSNSYSKINFCHTLTFLHVITSKKLTHPCYRE